MKSKVWYFLLLALVFGLGLFVSYRLQRGGEEKKQIEATVVLEQIREVCQLITVEAQYNELYNETNIREVTLYLPIPTYWEFSKKALLEVKGRVLVGYDMAQVNFTVDSTSQEIRINNLPYPTILAVDHELSYRHLEESYFNEFSPEDYTQLNRNAKQVLRDKAYESGLLEQAREQGIAMLDAMRFMAENIGWTLVYVLPDAELPTPIEQ